MNFMNFIILEVMFFSKVHFAVQIQLAFNSNKTRHLISCLLTRK